MKELRAIVETAQRARSEGKAAALATVVAVRGSAYRRPGARMLITDEGSTTGAISGGCLEQDVILRARRVLERGEATVVAYDTTEEGDVVSGVGLGCRGVIELLIELLPRTSEPSYLPLLEELLRRREAGVLATVWRVDGSIEARAGSRLLLGRSGRLWDDIGDPQLGAQIEEDARDVVQTLRSGSRVYRLAAGQAEVFLELVRAPVRLVLFGGGEDAVPLARGAAALGWHVTVVDGRPAAASRARFPWADVVLCHPDQVPERVQLDGETLAVVITHSYLTDLRLLEVLLPSPVRYLGLLGPKSRAERLLQDLSQAGIRTTAAQRGRLYAPVGLDLGAETPEEIALAILAEIRTVLAGRAGGFLRERRAPIHERRGPEERQEWRTLPGAEGQPCAISAS